ncbi:hypothetical protein [Arthrobacter sp. MYb227]|uniref:hypothetical protein n=1 Tax=Arthrobacter sp. MYb227 TaxID=1848601 RepID=UPI0011AFDD29|nr:hypothetical protein [Arthrobacter sp. MYb227]
MKMNSAERTAGVVIEVIEVDMMKIPQGFGRKMTHQPREFYVARKKLAGRHSRGRRSGHRGKAAKAEPGHIEARKIH